MNYFGLFFTFMLPGLLLGAMGAAALYDARTRHMRKKAAAKRAQAQRERTRLYVHSLLEDIEGNAA